MKLFARFRQFQVSSAGFTLIELLIVIAVLGLLAAVVLVALDPIEQTAKARDAGRINTVAQVGRALQTYASNQLGQYPDPSVNPPWMTALKTNGDIKNDVSVPAVAGSANVCTTNEINNICYVTNAGFTEGYVWTVAESKGSKSKPTTDCTAFTLIVYSSLLGKAGIYCHSAANLTAAQAAAITALY